MSRKNVSGIDWADKKQRAAYQRANRIADIDHYNDILLRNSQREKKKRILKRIKAKQGYICGTRSTYRCFLRKEVAHLMKRGKTVGEMVPLLERPYSLIQKFHDEILAEEKTGTVTGLQHIGQGSESPTHPGL